MIVGAGITPAERAAIEAGAYRFARWKDELARRELRPRPTPRWKPLIPHPEMMRALTSPARFKVVVAGRGSGKSESWKRELCRRAWSPQKVQGARYGFFAPTYPQVKNLFWEDAKALIPRHFIVGRPHETELRIRLTSGASIHFVGMDRPERIEGIDFQFVILDEYADWKPNAWNDSIRPMLDRIGREGQAVFLGRPRSRNHFYRMVEDFAKHPEKPEWDYFHWSSRDIMNEDVIESAMDGSDARTFRQNYDAEFEDDVGRAYYGFKRELQVEPVKYDKQTPLIACFDFNKAPGVACFVQELPYHGGRPKVAPNVTAVIGEIWIDSDSNSEKVARLVAKQIREWGYPPKLYLEGDYSGKAGTSASVKGPDWDLIRNTLDVELPGLPIVSRVEPNPLIKARVNAMNTRLLSASGVISMLIDPSCVKMIRDLEQVSWDEDGEKIAKEHGDVLTHISDSLGYFVERKHPVRAKSIGGAKPM